MSSNNQHYDCQQLFGEYTRTEKPAPTLNRYWKSTKQQQPLTSYMHTSIQITNIDEIYNTDRQELNVV